LSGGFFAEYGRPTIVKDVKSDSLILDLLIKREEQIHSQADAIDTKANYFFVAIIFLAQLSVSIFSSIHLNYCILLFLLMAICATASAGAFIFLTWKLRGYQALSAEDLRAHRVTCNARYLADIASGDNEWKNNSKEDYFHASLITDAEERIKSSCAIVDDKIKQYGRAQIALIASAALHGLALLLLLLSRFTHVSL
jgi:hypothetical protein